MRSWKQKMTNQGGMEPRERQKTAKTMMMTTMISRTPPWTTSPSTWPDWSAILATRSSPSRAMLTGPSQRSNAWLTKLSICFDENFQVHKRSQNWSGVQIWLCWEVGQRGDRFGEKTIQTICIEMFIHLFMDKFGAKIDLYLLTYFIPLLFRWWTSLTTSESLWTAKVFKSTCKQQGEKSLCLWWPGSLHLGLLRLDILFIDHFHLDATFLCHYQSQRLFSGLPQESWSNL